MRWPLYIPIIGAVLFEVKGGFFLNEVAEVLYFTYHTLCALGIILFIL